MLFIIPAICDGDTQKTLHKLNSLYFIGIDSLIPVKCKLFIIPVS